MHRLRESWSNTLITHLFSNKFLISFFVFDFFLRCLFSLFLVLLFSSILVSFLCCLSYLTDISHFLIRFMITICHYHIIFPKTTVQKQKNKITPTGLGGGILFNLFWVRIMPNSIIILMQSHLSFFYFLTSTCKSNLNFVWTSIQTTRQYAQLRALSERERALLSLFLCSPSYLPLI